MKVEVEVVVTAEDIALGVTHSHLECPIARALFRAMGNTWLVTGSAMAGRWRAEHRVLALPKEVGGFLVAFDAGEEVLPFSFVVEVPA